MKRMVKHLAAALAVVCLSAGIAAAAPQKIQFWHGMGGTLGTKTAEFVKQFNESQKDYEIEFIYRGTYDETITAAIAAYRGKQAPHIVQVNEVGTASMMAAKGAVRPVHQVMADAGSPLDMKRFIPAIASYFSNSDGKLVALPFNSSSPVLYYNKDALKKAGYDPEAPFPRTWPEVIEMARKIKKAGYKHGFTSAWQSWIQLENLSTLHNVPFASRGNGMDGLDAQLAFNSEFHIKHISTLKQLMEEGVYVYAGAGAGAVNTFFAEDVGILTNSSGSQANVRTNAKFPFGIAMIPYWPDVKAAPQNTIIGGAALWVMGGHSKAEEKGIAAFFNWLLLPEQQYEFHKTTGYVPVTQAGYELAKEKGLYKEDPRFEVAIQSLNLKPPTPLTRGVRLGNFTQIRQVIDEELELLWAGKKTPKQALDSAVERGDQLLRRFERMSKIQ